MKLKSHSSRILTALGTGPDGKVMTTSRFMRHYWHRQPVLLRSCFTNFQSPVTIENMLEFCSSGEGQTRLIKRSPKHAWSLQQGPLYKLPSLKTKNWTVLLQGADIHSDDIRALLDRFRFLPDARLDDLMISLASDGGSVGPHIDSYDVFLLQAVGLRHWRWGKVQRPRQDPHAPIKLISNFKGGHSALLEPGDMLYLPPGWAHEGIARGACMTFSIGFRASTRAELIQDVMLRAIEEVHLQAQLAPDSRIIDERRRVSATPARLADLELKNYLRWLKDYRPSQAQWTRWIGEHLTEPRAAAEFDAPDSPMSHKRFQQQLKRNGARMHRAARALYRGDQFFVNGQSLKVSREALGKQGVEALQELFDQRGWPPGVSQPPSMKPLLDQLYEGYLKGWLNL